MSPLVDEQRWADLRVLVVNPLLKKQLWTALIFVTFHGSEKVWKGNKTSSLMRLGGVLRFITRHGEGFSKTPCRSSRASQLLRRLSSSLGSV